jgi:hypothetical protein
VKKRKIGNMDEIDNEKSIGSIKYSPVDLADEINKMLDNKPPRRPSAPYKEWKGKINTMMAVYNELIGWKCFIYEK